MNGMTTQERYAEICKLSGMSEDIVRRVLGAEKQSIINSLKRGERATLLGRCVLRPEIKTRLVVGGQIVKYIKIYAEAAPSLESSLEGMERFEGGEENTQVEGIRINQIPSLV